MPRTLLLLLAAAAGLSAAEAPGAKEVLEKAVATQGAIPAGEIHDITLTFEGQIAEGKRINTIKRVYRYRARDRSFFVSTESKASAKIRSVRGVLGESGYWERSSRGRIIRLRPGNREDKASVKTIRKNRDDFEAMLRMVLLARIADGESKLKLVTRAPVRLEQDMPYAADQTLGKDRRAHQYYVLDLERKDQPKLRLFIQLGTFTVRKVVQFDAEDPSQRKWFYYFGPFRKDPGTGLNLPEYFSVYDGLPVDRKSMEERNRVRGEPTVKINTGLEDEAFRPAK
ncbi:MAG: hypothetical protein ACYTG3_11910 [Planctomycetota bacterium]|jgi:hypothetical protein